MGEGLRRRCRLRRALRFCPFASSSSSPSAPLILTGQYPYCYIYASSIYIAKLKLVYFELIIIYFEVESENREV